MQHGLPIITAAGIYPHWLRGRRASCLISEYGWTMEQMMEWMGWEELSTARHYARFGPTKLVAGRKYDSANVEAIRICERPSKE